MALGRRRQQGQGGGLAEVAVAEHQLRRLELNHLAPKLTERISAKLSLAEAEKASPMPDTTGAIHEAVDDGLRIDGGIRERMRQEDAARA